MDLESNNKQKKVWLESIREISFGRPRFFFVCMHTVKYNLESEQTANTKKKQQKWHAVNVIQKSYGIFDENRILTTTLQMQSFFHCTELTQFCKRKKQ